MEIAGIEIGHGHPCRTVAEVGNAHNGSYERCIRILNAIKASGATFAKFQCYTPDELVALRGDGPAPEPWGGQGWTMRRLYEKAQTPHAWFPDLVKHCERIHLPWFASVFGGGSLLLMESLGCPAYKLASLDREARSLLAGMRATGKPIVRSTPNTDEWYFGDIRLYCPPGYPQAEVDFSAMRSFEGYSYHGIEPLIPTIAALYGAHIVECHFQLDDEPSELEAAVSLTATAFARMVGDIRKVEALAA